MTTSSIITPGCDYDKAINIINNGSVKEIFACISKDIFTYTSYRVSTHSGNFVDENSIAVIILQIVKIASKTFCKDIAEKLFDKKTKQDNDTFGKKWNIGLTEKQAWCIAFDIEKNREEYSKVAVAYCEEEWNTYPDTTEAN